MKKLNPTPYLISRKSKGFTAIELMVVVLIAGILVAIATPGLKSWIGSIRAQAQANSILAGLNKARSEAINRNMPIVFNLNANGYWQYGCVRVDTTATSGTYCPSAILEKNTDVIPPSGSTTITITPSANGYVVFNSLGVATDSSSYGSARISNINVVNQSKLYNIVLRSGGAAKMCIGACT